MGPSATKPRGDSVAHQRKKGTGRYPRRPAGGDARMNMPYRADGRRT